MADDMNRKEDYARNIMESYTKEWRIFMDTCSILHFAVDKFWMNMNHIGLRGQVKWRVSPDFVH